MKSSRISEASAMAFLLGRKFTNNNTKVVVFENIVELILHKSVIARLKLGEAFFEISTCGWETMVTKNRLTALPNVSVYTRKGVLYLNGNEWDGKFTTIEL